jgi:hypothetical protein
MHELTSGPGAHVNRRSTPHCIYGWRCLYERIGIPLQTACDLHATPHSCTDPILHELVAALCDTCTIQTQHTAAAAAAAALKALKKLVLRCCCNALPMCVLFPLSDVPHCVRQLCKPLSQMNTVSLLQHHQ